MAGKEVRRKMGRVHLPDVVGLWVLAGEIVCRECWTQEEIDRAREEDFITQDEVEDVEEMYFCDRCKKRLC